MTKRNTHLASVLRIRPFLFLWFSQIFSQIAFNMLNFVLLLRVYQLTASNVAVSLLVLSFIFPQLVISLFAGVLVDRLDKKVVMILTNITRALVLLPIIIYGSNMLFLYACAFAIATVTQFFLPAEVPMIPKLVPKRFLLSANAMFTGTLYGSIIVGYILAGPSLKFMGVSMTFLLLAMLFAIAALFNTLLPGKTGGRYLKRQMQKISNVTYRRLINVIFNDIGEVLFAILRSKHVLLAIVFLTISQTVIVMLGALLPGYAATILSIDVEDSSLLLLAPAAAGMVAGSLFVGRSGRKLKRERFIAPGILASGFMLLLLPIFARAPYSPNSVFAFVIGICFLLGVFNAMIIIPANTIIQERSVEGIRGRIYGLFNGLSALASIAPVAIAGYFSDVFGVGRVLTGIGIAIMVIGVVPLVRIKEEL